MSGILLSVLFVATGLFALITVGQNWSRYGRVALALRADLRECSEWRDVTVTVTEIKLHPSGATVLRPEFRPRRSQAPIPALPAAA